MKIIFIVLSLAVIFLAGGIGLILSFEPKEPFARQGIIIPEDVEFVLTPKNMELRHRTATSIALAQDEVILILHDSKNYDANYHWLDKNIDLVTIHARKSIFYEPLDGDYINGYNVIVSGIRKIDVEIDRTTNIVKSLVVQDSPDTRDEVKFSDNQKRIIKIALKHPLVKQKIFDKSYFIQQVRESGVSIGNAPCSPASCALVGFSMPDNGGVMLAVILDPATGKIYDIRGNLN